MSKKWALLAGAAIGAGALLPSAAHAQGGRGPFADVPETHWAYDAVRQLAARGIFTGYPDGTFSGRRALTRYEFAVALQRMLQEVERLIANIEHPERQPGTPGPAGPTGPPGPRGPGGPPGSPGVTPDQLQELIRQQGLLRSDITALQKLAQEFSQELAMLGTEVEQIKRNLQALADRLGSVERTIARMPKITGAMNVGFRGSFVESPEFIEPRPGGGLREARNQDFRPIAGMVDRDGRLLNPSDSFLDRINAFYDIDLGVTANISDVATARLLLNAGNYLRGYLGNRISQVHPLIDRGVEGETRFPNFAVEDVVPYYLYIETPVKLGGAGAHLTVGKFGHQFTPYTLRMVDVDSYFHNDKTDLGDYPIAGGRVNFRALGLNFQLYAGRHDTEYGQLTSTAGFVAPGLYLPDIAKFVPQGRRSFAGPIVPGQIGAGSTILEQSAGGRISYANKRFQLGATYLTATGDTDAVFDPDPNAIRNNLGAIGLGGFGGFRTNARNDFRQLSVYGVDWNIGIWRGIAFSGAVTESRWDSRGPLAGFTSGDNAQLKAFAPFGVSANNRRAYDLRLKIPVLGGLLTGFYKRIGDGFDAPGYWGRIGNWINPRGIEGFGGTLEVPIGSGLVLDVEGGGYHYRFNPIGTAASDLAHIRAGLRFPLTSRNSVDLGGEYVRYAADGPGGIDRIERYFNAGFSHQFNPNMSLRLMYQFMNIDSQGILELPGFDYKAGVVATQFQVRF